MNKPESTKISEKTGQTGQAQPQPYKEPYFELSQDKKTEAWNWILWAANGRPMATNAVPYDRRNDATEAIETLRGNIAKATKVVIVHK